ncbi:MAG: hypothetical protein EOP56_19065 [Sphingobacteriales bacterium]|nr:MAG: hypothetical protein EOP56_19065 [Sphingobacteriales bacterium]
MRKVIFITVTFLLCIYYSPVYSQQKTIYGDFIFNEVVYTYKAARFNDKYTLKVNSLMKTSDYIGQLDAKKLDATMQYLDSIYSEPTVVNDTQKIRRVKSIVDSIIAIRQQKTSWKSDLETVSDLISYLDTVKIDTVKVDYRYNLYTLVSAYKSFLRRVADLPETDDVPFDKMEKEVFTSILINQLMVLNEEMNISSLKKNGAFLDLAHGLMVEIKTRFEFENDEPQTAFVMLKRKSIDIKVKLPRKELYDFMTDKTTKLPERKVQKEIEVPFKIQSVTLEFEDGTIKNIDAQLIPLHPAYKAIYGDHPLSFKNAYPVSISGKYDAEEFNYKFITLDNTAELVSTLYDDFAKKHPNNDIVTKEKKRYFDYSRKYRHAQVSFALSQLIDYKLVYQNDNEDYSPHTENPIVLTPANPIVELKKEKKSRLFVARAYTDVIGLNDEEPNGLVQIEISRKMNLWTKRVHGVRWIAPNEQGIYNGFLTYVEPRLTFSKIESNNRYYYIDSFQLERAKSIADSSNHFQLNPVEVLRYQRWSIGADINLFKLNIQNLKTNFQINGTFGYSRMQAADSILITGGNITNISTLNITSLSSTYWGPSLQAEIKPDPRYGFTLGYEWKWMDIYHPQYEYQTGLSNILHTTWLAAHLKLNTNSKVFFRFRKHWLHNSKDFNFDQIHVGYELELFKSE